jgi:hypothetical protein
MVKVLSSKGETRGCFFAFSIHLLRGYISVAILPPSTQWGELKPKKQDGHLHADCYWFAVINDLRGSSSQLWVKINWFYKKHDLQDLALSKPKHYKELQKYLWVNLSSCT